MITICHLIKRYDLDAIVVPQPRPEFIPLWQSALGADRVVADPRDIPMSHDRARISHPTRLDWSFGSAGWTVFESVMWENGFFDTRELHIVPPIVFPANHRADAVMIFPAEATDGNRVYDADWWVRTCNELWSGGWRVNLLEGTDHPPLKTFYQRAPFDAIFPPTIEGLRACVTSSSLAVGGSTGPTWAFLMSDIPQVVLESKRAPHGYWFFDRCQAVLAKRLRILSTLESAAPENSAARPLTWRCSAFGVFRSNERAQVVDLGFDRNRFASCRGIIPRSGCRQRQFFRRLFARRASSAPTSITLAPHLLLAFAASPRLGGDVYCSGQLSK